MKHSSLLKFYLLVIGFAITFCGCKKNGSSNGSTNASGGKYLTSQEVYLWSNGQWKKIIGKDAIGYDNDCYLNSVLSTVFDSVSGNWVNSGLVSKINNPNGTTANSTSQIWDSASNNWVNLQKSTYTYVNSDSGYSTWLIQTWANGQWQNASLSTASYNNNNQLVQVQSQRWDNATSMWIAFEETDNTYGSNGKLSQSLITIPTSGITTYQRSSYTYDGTGNLITILEEAALYSPANWINEGTTTYSYNADGHISSFIVQLWDQSNSIWVNDEKIVSSYSNSCH
jgi:hypothetical protein